jgi:hypothetical protein
VLGIGAAVGSGLTEAATAAAATSQPLTVQAHGSFGDCSVKTTWDRVKINRDTFRTGQTLRVSMTATNDGQSCTYYDYDNASYAGPAPLGPCGAAPIVILNKNGKDVWPGSGTWNCLALAQKTLNHEQSVKAQGEWNLKTASGQPVPPGDYTVAIAFVRFRIVVHG